MKKRSLVGLVVAALASLVTVLWVARWPAPADPGVLDASGRIEGDQAAVGAKVGGKIVRLAVREQLLSLLSPLRYYLERSGSESS